MPQTLEITIDETRAGFRLDKALAEASGVPDLSRARVQALLREGRVLLAGKPAGDASAKVRAGQVYVLTLPDPVPADPEAEAIPLSIVYEDDDIIVIDKPAGLVVHPAAGNWTGTLVNALLAHCGESLRGIGGVARPGIVHRLDKETSGLMVAAKNDTAHHGLVGQFADRSLSRTYRALVWGVPSPVSGQIEGAIGRHPKARQKMAVVAKGGKEALTFYRVVEAYGTLASLVECTLATGRTHQIRVHMAHLGHPLVGDPMYGRKRTAAQKDGKGLIAAMERFPRQALHAVALKLTHPRSMKLLQFAAKMPEDMAELIHFMKKSGSR